MVPKDALAASKAAQQQFRHGAYHEAIAASDVVIASMLRRPMAIGSFIQACARAAHPSRMLRYGSAEVLQLGHLRKALVIRWDALHRLGNHREADAMGLACQRLFPRQRSVAVLAGNHALDRHDVGAAKRHFNRAIALDPTEVAAIAGLAIVSEIQKDWPAALTLRHQVAELSGAFDRQDTASLHRVLRYAAALGRLDRWQEAGAWFRRCVRRGAFEKLPQERAVLLKVFSGPVYSPAMVLAMLSGHASQPTIPLPPQQADAVARCLRDAAQITALTAAPFAADKADDPAETRAGDALLSGMRAWALGDPEAAYHQFNQADLPAASTVGDREMCAHYLLLRSAQTISAADLHSIAEFALGRARAVLASACAGEEARLYAHLTMMQLGPTAADGSEFVGDGLAGHAPTLPQLDSNIGSLRGYVAAQELRAAAERSAWAQAPQRPMPIR